MMKKADQLKLDRELKHLRIKLKESEEEIKTAVEIIGNLHREREDLMQRNETIATTLQAVQTELKIVDQKYKSLEQMYRDDASKFKEEAATAEKRMTMIQEQINQKDLELNDAKEYQNRLQHELRDANAAINEDAEEDDNEHAMDSVKETQLKAQLAAERKKVQEKEAQIDKLVAQLNRSAAIKQERDKLKKELHNLETMATEDLGLQKMQIDKMQREIITLASRNSKLETEKDDLIAMLEERDYENQMLKTGFGLHREKTARARGSNQFRVDDFPPNDDVVPDDQYDEDMNGLETLAFIDNVSAQPSIRGFDDGDHSFLERENSYIGSSGSSPKARAEVVVADVTREYLHLTASVVNMKYPGIQHITSEDLINKVKNYQFFEYHDMMVNIMRMEQEKKQKEEEEKKAKARQQRLENGQKQQKPESSGYLSRFRKFFAPKDELKQTKSTTSVYTKGGLGRASEIVKSSSHLPKQQMPRQRGATVDDAKQNGGGGVDDVAKRGKEFLGTAAKKGKELSDGAKKKITGVPSEKRSEQLNNMSFQPVPDVGRSNHFADAVLDAASQSQSLPKEQSKAKRPKQGL